MQNLNNLSIYHRELRIVAEFKINDIGAVQIPSKIKTQLNQLGIYELDLWDKFFEHYIFNLRHLFTSEDEVEDDEDEEDYDLLYSEHNGLTDVSDFFNFYTLMEYNFLYLPTSSIIQYNIKDIFDFQFNFNNPANNDVPEIASLFDDNHQELVEQTSNEEQNIDDIDIDSNEEDEFSLYVTVIIFFYKRKGKTIVHFTNPFVAADLTSLIWLNTFDFYSLVENQMNFFKLYPYYRKIAYRLDYIWDYQNYITFINLKKFWIDKTSLKALFYNFRTFKFRQLTNKFFIKWYKRKIKLRLILKKRKIRRIYHSLYLIKSKKWISFDSLFKLMVWKTIFLKFYFNLDDLKNYLYSLFSLSVFYKGYLKKKYKKRKRFKDFLKRNIYGQIT